MQVRPITTSSAHLSRPLKSRLLNGQDPAASRYTDGPIGRCRRVAIPRAGRACASLKVRWSEVGPRDLRGVASVGAQPSLTWADKIFGTDAATLRQVIVKSLAAACSQSQDAQDVSRA